MCQNNQKEVTKYLHRFFKKNHQHKTSKNTYKHKYLAIRLIKLFINSLTQQKHLMIYKE